MLHLRFRTRWLKLLSDHVTQRLERPLTILLGQHFPKLIQKQVLPRIR